MLLRPMLTILTLKMQETRPTAYSLYPRRSESLTIGKVLLRPMLTILTLKMQETGPTVYSPYPRRFESLTIGKVLLRPMLTILTLKMQETGPKVYSPYPRRSESLTICWCNYLTSYFKTLSVGPTGVELMTSRVTARCSTD